MTMNMSYVIRSAAKQSCHFSEKKKIPMIRTRSALMLHLHKPPIPRQFLNHAPTFLRSTTSPSLFQAHFFSLTPQRRTRITPFGTSVAAASSVEDSKGRDTFFAEENVSWSSLGLSDTLSRALSNIGLKRPSFVQVPFYLFIYFSLRFFRFQLFSR